MLLGLHIFVHISSCITHSSSVSDLCVVQQTLVSKMADVKAIHIFPAATESSKPSPSFDESSHGTNRPIHSESPCGIEELLREGTDAVARARAAVCEQMQKATEKLMAVNTKDQYYENSALLHAKNKSGTVASVFHDALRVSKGGITKEKLVRQLFYVADPEDDQCMAPETRSKVRQPVVHQNLISASHKLQYVFPWLNFPKTYAIFHRNNLCNRTCVQS